MLDRWEPKKENVYEEEGNVNEEERLIENANEGTNEKENNITRSPIYNNR